MRLKSVWIESYKNLRDLTINFLPGNANNIEILVGKNASGKSNLFEALIEIFRHLHEHERRNATIAFSYSIAYEIEGELISVEWKSDRFLINNQKRKNLRDIRRPDSVLVYYSGHNDHVATVLRQYEAAFRRRIKTASPDEFRHFIGIGPEYKQLLLTVLVLQASENEARNFVFTKLGIDKIAHEFKVVLRRPIYASSAKFDVEANDEHDRFWRAEGITKTFLNLLTDCTSQAEGGYVRSEGYFAAEDRYIIYVDIAKFREMTAESTSLEIFRQFDNLRVINMLEDLSCTLHLSDGTEAEISYFSDGQIQSVYIYAISEIFKEQNCVILLDEPDSFLHPEWQFEFLEQVERVSRSAKISSQILMSSHSGITLLGHKNRKIHVLEYKEEKTLCYPVPKFIAVRKLSNNIIEYVEKENLLSIINTVQIEKKPVLFTEGSTDPIILKEAWYKLFDDDLPFIPFYAFSSTFLKGLLTDDRILNEMNGIPVFGIFDFDKAFDQWNGLNGEIIQDDPNQGLVKKLNHGQAYALMIPIIMNPDIRRQVIKNEKTLESFGGESRYEIEHCFYGFDVTDEFFETEVSPGGSVIVFKSDGAKTRFATEVIRRIDGEAFEVFRPMFHFLREKCGAVKS